MVFRVLERIEERFWARHSNPKSGWSRVPVGAVIVCALYRRDWRLLAGAVGFLGALVAAWRRRPAAATLGTLASVGLKLWWLRVLVRRYDEQKNYRPGRDSSATTPEECVRLVIHPVCGATA